MACKLVAIPNSRDFECPAGEKVTLVTKDQIGTVLIETAEYAGSDLVPQGQALNRVQLTVVPGPKTVKMVFVFAAGGNGVGELREDGTGDSQFLRALSGAEPFKAFRIIGK